MIFQLIKDAFAANFLFTLVLTLGFGLLVSTCFTLPLLAIMSKPKAPTGLFGEDKYASENVTSQILWGLTAICITATYFTYPLYVEHLSFLLEK